MQKPIIIIAAAAAALALTGCGYIHNAAEKSYGLISDSIDQADGYKAAIANDNFERAQRRREFVDKIGGEIDAADIGALKNHLARDAEFYCGLKEIGVTIAAIPTRDAQAVAHITCVSSPEE